MITDIGSGREIVFSLGIISLGFELIDFLSQLVDLIANVFFVLVFSLEGTKLVFDIGDRFFGQFKTFFGRFIFFSLNALSASFLYGQADVETHLQCMYLDFQAQFLSFELVDSFRPSLSGDLDST